MDKKPLVLVILDGWGEWSVGMGNAILNANLPTIDRLNKYYPKIFLQASGLSVGLPWGVKGNSEVGHQTIGTGQIIFQYLPTIDMAIRNKTFYENKTLLEAIRLAKKNNKKIHILGLLSDGGVHSHINHLLALIDVCREQTFDNFFVHAITDGRDTSFKSAKKYLSILENHLETIKMGKLATISGRYYTMDRNNNWDRIEKAFKSLAHGDGILEKNVDDALDNQYKKEVFDEFLEPINLVDDSNNPIGLIEEGDIVVCFNFRKDRSRQIARVFVDQNFSEFLNTELINDVNFYSFSEYDENLDLNIIFPPQKITSYIGKEIANAKKNQLRIAETEKYAHVTYFFNGGLEDPFINEDRIIIPSRRVKNYADAPEMSADKITEKVLENLDKDKYDFILLNYANPDMVGHTGDLEAAIKAIEKVDSCLGKIIDRVFELEGKLLITSDHGNVEKMIDPITYEKDTEHSTNSVPCWLASIDHIREEALQKMPSSKKIDGMIVDIAPTVLELLNIVKPNDMVGISLLNLFKKKIKNPLLY